MLMDEAVQRMAQADGFKLLLIDRLQKFVLKKAATVVIPTGTLRQACLKTVPAERISILPLPAERLTSVPFPVERAESDVLALGGSLTAADIRSLLDGFILLSEYFPAFHLRIVGEVAEPSDLADAITQARSGKFEYLGFASRAETAYFLRSATVCLVGGRSRDTHQACTSAYAAETTLVAVATDANREVVEHGVSGLLVEASGESFARAVLSLMKDGVKRAALVEGGERLLRDRFGWEKHLEGFRDIVKRNSKYAD
jgi:glycosyltransferase involved in cell wall biosynthesis